MRLGVQVNVPKTKKAYCKDKNCKKHTVHKVTQYKTGKARLYAQGEAPAASEGCQLVGQQSARRRRDRATRLRHVTWGLAACHLFRQGRGVTGCERLLSSRLYSLLSTLEADCSGQSPMQLDPDASGWQRSRCSPGLSVVRAAKELAVQHCSYQDADPAELAPGVQARGGTTASRQAMEARPSLSSTRRPRPPRRSP